MRNFFITSMLILFSLHVFCQTEKVEITKSSEKILVAGNVYYIHIVLPGQTIYSISKAYNVTIEDIESANPGIIVTQIKTGQSIKIPEKSFKQPSEKRKEDKMDDDYFYHQVNQGETVYFISKKYGVSVNVIYKYNPETETSLKIGQVVKIPKKKVNKEDKDRILQEDPNFSYYEVKQNDTLYSIARQYNVTVADIINSNPELRWGLKTGQIIKIPRVSFLTIVQPPLSDSIQPDTTVYFLSETDCDSIASEPTPKQIRLALILPFMADKLHRISIDDTLLYDEDSDYNQPSSVSIGANYLQFYQGVITALDSLKKEGFVIRLSVYDSEQDTNKIKRIINMMYSDPPDMIIGPVLPACLKQILFFAEKFSIPVISPFYNRTEQLKQYSEIFQVIPSFKVENDAIINFLVKNKDKNLLVVHNGDTVNNQDINSFRKCFSDYQKDSTVKQNLFSEILNNDTATANFHSILSADKKNIIVILSDNGIYVNSLLTRFDMNSKRYDITVVGQPSWFTFQTINVEYYHNLTVTVFTPFFVDYNELQTKKFLKYFIKLYGTEPEGLNSNGYNSTYLGYDVAMYFIKAYQKFGQNFYKCLPYFETDNVLTGFSFTPIENARGLENKTMNCVIFNKEGYKVSKEKVTD